MWKGRQRRRDNQVKVLRQKGGRRHLQRVFYARLQQRAKAWSEEPVGFRPKKGDLLSHGWLKTRKVIAGNQLDCKETKSLSRLPQKEIAKPKTTNKFNVGITKGCSDEQSGGERWS